MDYLTFTQVGLKNTCYNTGHMISKKTALVICSQVKTIFDIFNQIEELIRVILINNTQSGFAVNMWRSARTWYEWRDGRRGSLQYV